ncbi:hypothetical protein J3R30DRAFT_2213863 [Lentinula aciculospora]|uniref:Uncharacterized protein n=1 Tax=Lentinula aciculospora TaxID=153920 RepID=A0A9W8ZVD0_9AGAR|nr:hypothetical protein J3R30DRAFT_2213863 [Lentinula aciculospora]
MNEQPVAIRDLFTCIMIGRASLEFHEVAPRSTTTGARHSPFEGATLFPGAAVQFLDCVRKACAQMDNRLKHSSRHPTCFANLCPTERQVLRNPLRSYCKNLACRHYRSRASILRIVIICSGRIGNFCSQNAAPYVLPSPPPPSNIPGMVMIRYEPALQHNRRSIGGPSILSSQPSLSMSIMQPPAFRAMKPFLLYIKHALTPL